MNNKLRPFLLTIPLFALGLCFFFLTYGTAWAQDKSLYWERYDVEIEVQPDGSFRVVEHNQINFTSGTFRFGTRSIPTERLVAIDQLAITFDGTPLVRNASGEQPGTFEMTSSSESMDVRYFFPEPISGRHEIDIAYVVQGGLRYYEEGDQLYWKAVHADRPATVENSRVTIHLPAGVVREQMLAQTYDTEANIDVSPDGRRLVFDAIGSISPGQELEVRVQFPHGVVSGSAPAWQARADEEDAAADARAARETTINTLAGGSSLVLLIGGFLSVIMLWWAKGRDYAVELTAEYLTEPPDNLPPGVVGTLLDEKADLQDIMATLLDLARRGTLQIEEISPAEKGWFSKADADFLYTLKKRKGVANNAERILIQEFFGSHKRRKLDDLHQKFYSSIPKVKKALYAEVTARELFEKNPNKVRQRYRLGGMLLIGFSFLLFFIISSNLDWLLGEALLCLPFALGLTGIALSIMSQVMPRKTKAGSEAASKWRAFRRYLQNLEKYGDLEEKKAIWDQYLPYAVAFGLEKSYIQQFAKVNAPVPRWYMPYGYTHHYYDRSSPSPDLSHDESVNSGQVRDSFVGAENGGGLQGMSDNLGSGIQNMSDGLASMLSVTASTLTSTPPSESSGSSWSGGGGGGFSGGGGGGGGGGSSSFG